MLAPEPVVGLVHERAGRDEQDQTHGEKDQRHDTQHPPVEGAGFSHWG